MKRSFTLILAICALAFSQSAVHSSGDSARAKSIYFTAIFDFTNDGTSQTYAKNWRVWLQLHRAIETKPDLAKALERNPANYNSDKGRSLSWIQNRLPASEITAQPAHVYILQLAAFDRPQSLENFMVEQWPKVARQAVYAKTPKKFYVGFSNEAASKSDPLFVLREKNKGCSILRLNYGIYESIQDARRDAALFKAFLKVNPLVRKTNLTPQLARAFIAAPVAGRLPGKGAQGFSLAW